MSLLAKARALSGRAEIASATESLAGGTSVSEKRKKKSVRERLARSTVEWTPDFERIKNLPRRIKPNAQAMEELIKDMTARHKRPEGTHTLWATQAWALDEMPRVGGGIGCIQAGEGKTLMGLLMPMTMPNCKHAVLLLPAGLKAQLFDRDWEFYGKHWKLPNLSGDKTGRWVQGRPTLRVISYSEASSTKNTEMLEHEHADLVIGDEVDSLRNPGASRVVRFLRLFAKRPDTRFCGWSASLTSDSVSDYSHLCALALGDGSPLPIEPEVVRMWGGALDAGATTYTDPGVLRGLCEPGEDVQSGFRRRLIETAGFIATEESAIPSKLILMERKAPEMGEELTQHLRVLRRAPSAGGWKRPDGEELEDAMAVTECARQMIQGFHYYWHYYRNEPVELRDAWFARRQEWNRELRAKLMHAERFLESPKLCENAAERWFDGGCITCPRGPQEAHATGCKNARTHPLWNSQTYLAWRDIRHQVKHDQRESWLDEYLLKDVKEWMKTPGLVWVEHTAIGHKLASYTGHTYYGSGKAASEEIIKENGSNAIIVSLDSHKAGKNLQVEFNRNLFITIVASNAHIEQAIARTHRNGQPKPEVTVEMYLHVNELQDALDKAEERARYVTRTTGNAQKLNFGEWR